MAVKLLFTRPDGTSVRTCLSTDAKPNATVGSHLYYTDEPTKLEMMGSGWEVVGVGGAASVSQATISSGRNMDSTTNNYDAVHEEVNKTDVAAGSTDSAVSSGAPAFLYGLYVTASSGDITIKDGTGTEFTLTAPPAGPFDLGNSGAGIRFETDIRVTTAAATACKVYWRAI